MLVYYSGRASHAESESPEKSLRELVCVMLSYDVLLAYPDQRRRLTWMEGQRSAEVLRGSTSKPTQ